MIYHENKRLGLEVLEEHVENGELYDNEESELVL